MLIAQWDEMCTLQRQFGIGLSRVVTKLDLENIGRKNLYNCSNLTTL